MTARFFRRAISWDDYRARLGLVAPPGIEAPEPQYNIAPSQLVPILRASAPGTWLGDYAPRGAVIMQPAFWGLVPAWWNKPLSEKKFSTFNARAETIATSRAFSGALRQGRCLVPASGFYVWSGPKGRTTPFAVGPKNEAPNASEQTPSERSDAWLCFAGLWSRWMFEGSEIDTFAIVTVEANSLVAALGASSMPAILSPTDYTPWLDLTHPNPLSLLKPYPPDQLHTWPAHPSVGNVRNQGAEVLGE